MEGIFIGVEKLANFKYKWVTKNGDILIKQHENARTQKIQNHNDLYAVQQGEPAPNRYTQQPAVNFNANQNTFYAAPTAPRMIQSRFNNVHVNNVSPMYPPTSAAVLTSV